jgi:biofilm PGA synthesis N-glycosyltransferase PgaC
MSYALVTPARDEAANLQRLAQSVLTQTVRAEHWVIVDNGSGDGTRDVASALARAHPWIRLIVADGTAVAEPGQPIVRAFHLGLAEMTAPVDVVVKLDADVSFEPDYFERLLAEFATDPALGIAGGDCLEEEDGAWVVRHVTEGHVRGAARAYRWTCLQQVLPLEEQVGWDGIDELKANVRGWSTRIVDGLFFYHHRSVGERDGARTARWLRQGRASYLMGYRFSYLLLRTAHRSLRDPAALAMTWGYVGAALRREPRFSDELVRRHLRRRQSLRRLPLRALEALGRRNK